LPATQRIGDAPPAATPSIDELVELARSVPYADLYPVTANRIATLSQQGYSRRIEAHAAATRPVSHHKVEGLIEGFIDLMRQIHPYDKVYRGQGFPLPRKRSLWELGTFNDTQMIVGNVRGSCVTNARILK